jgi:hypothetical protein
MGPGMLLNPFKVANPLMLGMFSRDINTYLPANQAFQLV